MALPEIPLLFDMNDSITVKYIHKDQASRIAMAHGQACYDAGKADALESLSLPASPGYYRYTDEEHGINTIVKWTGQRWQQKRQTPAHMAKWVDNQHQCQLTMAYACGEMEEIKGEQ